MHWSEQYQPIKQDIDGLYLLVFPDPALPVDAWPFISFKHDKRRDLLHLLAVEAYRIGCCSAWQRTVKSEQQSLQRISP